MSWLQPVVFLTGVVMGTGSTITVKVMYGLSSVGLSGEESRFEKPLFTTWVMFIAMMIALPIHYLVEYYQRRKRRRKEAEGDEDIEEDGVRDLEAAEAESVPWRTFFILLIPSCFDLLGTALASIGLLFTTVSIYQLVRCSVIIVTAVLKATVLKQQLAHYMWIGIAINTVAMIMVSGTSFFSGTAEQPGVIDRDPRLGVAFILLSCLVQGSQYVFEEKVMTVDNAPPLVVVGMEGVWGTLLMPLVVFPWAFILPGNDYGGCMENILDSWEMVARSSAIQWILLIFIITVCLYNIFCIYVTFLLSSIWHAILDNFRPVSVWGFDLLLFYVLTDGTFGEAWTSESWLEFGGMILLFLGTAVYNGTVLLPCIRYEQKELEEIEKSHHPSVAALQEEERQGLLASGGTHSPTVDLSSPSITRSPLISRQLRSSPVTHAHVPRNLAAEFGPPHLSLNGSVDDLHQGTRIGSGSTASSHGRVVYGSTQGSQSSHKAPSSRTHTVKGRVAGRE